MNITLFQDVEEAWFWFIQANKAKQSGARVAANLGVYNRPCEPSDIMKICERLHRNRRLNMDHFRVMHHYGERMLAPDPTRAREILSAGLWNEAMDILGDVLIAKGIVYPKISADIIEFQKYVEGGQSW